MHCLPLKNIWSPARRAFLCIGMRHVSYGFLGIVLMMNASTHALGSVQKADMGLFALIEDSCLDCHDESEQKGNLRLDTLATVDADPSTMLTWLHVYDRVAAGEMPPAKKRFSLEEKNTFADALAADLRRFDAERQRSVGRVALRRLNASEYENIVRELLDIPDLSVAQYVPADAEYHGIENVAAMQQMAYNQIAQYLEAAETSLQAAVALRPKPDVDPVRYAAKSLGAHRKAFRSAHMIVDEQIVLIKEPVQAQGPWGLFTSPEEPGYYKIRFRAQSARIADSAFLNTEDPIAPPELLAGEKNQTVAIGVSLGRFLESFNVTPELDTYECTVWLNGDERLSFHCADLPFRDTKFATGRKPDVWDAVALEWAEIEGPIIAKWPPKGHRLLFGDLPIKKWTDESGYLPPRTIAMGTGENREVRKAPVGGPYFVKSKNPEKDSKRLLRNFMERAYRRPVNDDEVAVMQTRALDAMEQKICFQDGKSVV